MKLMLKVSHDWIVDLAIKIVNSISKHGSCWFLSLLQRKQQKKLLSTINIIRVWMDIVFKAK